MSWAKLDDRFWMHPKILTAGNSGAGIFARFLSYCGAYLTDGLVPAAVVELIVADDRDALTQLFLYGLLVEMESGGILIPDYLEHNRSKAQIESDREQRRANGTKGGRPRNGAPA